MQAKVSSYVQVYLPLPKFRSFTYRVPEEWQEMPRPGQLVLAPMGRRHVIGMVSPDQGGVAIPTGVEIKKLIEPLPPECSLSSKDLKLFQWVQGHYLASPGEVVRTFFPTALLKGKLDKGERARIRDPLEVFKPQEGITMNREQSESVAEVKSHLGNFFPALLHGITGSGKTEVYLRLCQEILDRGGGAIILVPEIALTPQMLGRFVGKFVDKVGTFHSGMTDTQRLQTWWSLKEGRQSIVVGTRSAIFLPVKNLSLIVVDEEHDSSFKQEERFRYHGRDVAVMRGKIEQIPVLLGSATPSLESQENVAKKKYHLLRLRERATKMGKLPVVHLVDLRKTPAHPETLLSEPLRDALYKTLERGEQALLFLNRRGFAPFILCEDCGEVLRCPNCEISLTYHRRPERLLCHYCEYLTDTLKQCPHCGIEALVPMGSGTERIEENFSKHFQGIRIGRLDRDVVSSQTKTEEILSQFEQGKLDVLIGTQLITKGHDFKRLTLVGILMADITLNLPDFRAAERLFQIVTQVSGRAGRHDLPGQVFLQTFSPEHYGIRTALNHDVEDFYVQEREHRIQVGYPPFTRLVQFKLRGNNLGRVKDGVHAIAADLHRLFDSHQGVKILGPAPAIFEKLRGKHRWQILLRLQSFEGVRRVLVDKIPHWEESLPSGVQLNLDVDPVGIY